MSALIIGGDNLGSIPYKLYEKGFKDIDHISGRKGGDRRGDILLRIDRADLVIVLVDYISHCIMKNTKEKLKGVKTKMIFTKRSWSYMEQEINNFFKNLDDFASNNVIK